MVGAWIAAQAIWLGTAYQLEFMAREVYLLLWAAGIALLGVSTWVLGEVIEGWSPRDDRIKVD
jgi:phosphatidylinositol glycan class M